MSDDPRAAASTSGPRPDGPAGTSATATSEPDWTDQVTDLIVDSVDKARSRSTGPIIEISKGSVHALVALIVLLPVMVLFAVGAVRLLDWAIPGDVWIIYAGLGSILVLAGSLMWTRRATRV